MQQRTPNTALLGVFWFGLQVVWGALLGVSLQARSSELEPHSALHAYALLATLGAAVAAVVQIAAGMYSDRRTHLGSMRVEFYYAGVVIAGAGIAWFYFAPQFGQLIAAVVVLQFGMNVAIGPYQAAIPDVVDENRLGNASSWMAALQSAGNAAGAVAAGLLSDVRIMAGIVIASLAATCSITAAHVRTLERISIPPARVRIERAYVDLFISRALVYLGFYTLLGYLYFFIGETAGGAQTKTVTGYTLLAVTAAGVAGAALIAKPSDRLDQRALASVSAIVFAAFILALLAAHSVASIIILAAAAGAVWGAFLTADWALGCRFVPRAYAATALGVWNLALLLPQVFAPLIATLAIAILKTMIQSPAHAAFLAAIVEVLAGSIWIWRLPASKNIA